MWRVDSISSRQIRAARALLDWSQKELANATGISLATIRRIETGFMPRGATTTQIRQCLETAGIEFLESDGLRRRLSGVHIYEGGHGGKDFYEDLKQTVQHYGGDVLIVAPTSAAFAKYCGIGRITDLDALVDLNSTVTIKCLLTDEIEPPFSTPRFQFRVLPRTFMDPVPFCVYGEKYGIVAPNGEPFGKLILVESPKMVISARRHFTSLWEKATQTMPMVQKHTKSSR